MLRITEGPASQSRGRVVMRSDLHSTVTLFDILVAEILPGPDQSRDLSPRALSNISATLRLHLRP